MAAGKRDLVGGRVVVRVDGLRRHQPLALVDRAAGARHVALVLELRGAQQVADEVVAAHGERAVVAPLVGITDLHGDLRQFLLGLGARGRAHPFEPVDRSVERLEQVADQLEHAALGLGAEMRLDEHAADELAHVVVHGVHRAAPARQRFGHAVQRLLVELEFEVGELRRQRRRVVVEQLELEIHAPVGHRHGLHQLADALDERRLADVELLHRRAHAFEERQPVEARRQLLVFGQRHRVVGLHRIAVLHLGPLVVGDARLERRDARGRRSRIALAGARQHLLDVLGELRAELRVLLVGSQVVVAVGHGEPVLVQRADVDRRILVVGRREPGERLRNADALRVADVARHVARRGDRVDARQFVLERREPEAFDARGVHVGEIEVADLLRVRSRGRGWPACDAATMSCFTSSCAWSSRMMNEP